MLILGQDKDLLTDNLNLIIEETTFKNIGKVYVIQNEIYKIGYYATEERAKEVLQEIIKAYSEEDIYHIRKSELNSLKSLEEPKYIIKQVAIPKVYEMPEK